MKITTVEFVKSVASFEQIPKEYLNEIAFAGRSNVGKSSLINCLLNRKKIANNRLKDIIVIAGIPFLPTSVLQLDSQKRLEILLNSRL